MAKNKVFCIEEALSNDKLTKEDLRNTIRWIRDYMDDVKRDLNNLAGFEHHTLAIAAKCVASKMSKRDLIIKELGLNVL